jgi:hypothetical protein
MDAFRVWNSLSSRLLFSKSRLRFIRSLQLAIKTDNFLPAPCGLTANRSAKAGPVAHPKFVALNC